MADQQQLDLLRRDVIAWNAWRVEHPKVQVDLKDADLKRTNLKGANLFLANLESADLSQAKLFNANLNGAYLCKTDLRNADLSEANLHAADLRGAVLRGAVFIKADLSRANLFEVHFSKANLAKANLEGAELSQAHLSEAYLEGAHLSQADLSQANLSEAHFGYADLRRANLLFADLSRAFLFGSDLKKADLRGANLRGANLTQADLSGAYLNSVNLSEAIVENTSFGDRDLRVIKGIETIRHHGPSPLSINTIYLSGGDIPESFLQGTGAPDTFIEYVRALVNRPIEYYTCFISYSNKDKDLAERLYRDLQAKGVRCWFAPHDMKIGDEIRPRIDESIQSHDKLLLLLSEHSLVSNWVKKEVETAFEKEDQQKRLVLFPIRLDDAVMSTSQAWAADTRRMRHIGDFTNWKHHDFYQRAFDRLLGDLKAEGTASDA